MVVIRYVQMQQSAGKKSYRKSKIVLGIIALLIAGYFIYKYTYIYTERRKYDQAQEALSAVANDLRTQGIETSLYKNCERAQVKFGQGFLYCHVGIIYEGTEENITVKGPLEKFIKSVNQQNFVPTGIDNELSPTRNPIVVGTLGYTLNLSELRCGLSYDKDDDTSPSYSLTLGCGKSSKFPLF